MSINAVAHLAGAWIEIMYFPAFCLSPLSLTSRERGLKYTMTNWRKSWCTVAHLAGAWIEIIWIAALRALLIRRSPRGSVD